MKILSAYAVLSAVLLFGCSLRKTCDGNVWSNCDGESACPEPVLLARAEYFEGALDSVVVCRGQTEVFRARSFEDVINYLK